MNTQTFFVSFILGVALVLILVPEDEDVPSVPRFKCEAVDTAWCQYHTAFDLEADLRILKIFKNGSHSYDGLKMACE
jgi:hypothetical protein